MIPRFESSSGFLILLENTKYEFLLQMDWINMDFGAPRMWRNTNEYRHV